MGAFRITKKSISDKRMVKKEKSGGGDWECRPLKVRD